ncbi:protein of unknown function [Agrobacterium pusense]|uniref:Uncharacterized protein n=1 Tax=Agrobacterium pusense TaxID=648995 RepID=U4PS39_9HYPH|nr:protein of unknown function [Agrobacterium pusense]
MRLTPAVLGVTPDRAISLHSLGRHRPAVIVLGVESDWKAGNRRGGAGRFCAGVEAPGAEGRAYHHHHRLGRCLPLSAAAALQKIPSRRDEF